MKAFCVLFLFSVGLSAQSMLDVKHLAYVKKHLSDSFYAQAYQALENQAKRDLIMRPLTVMSKDYTPLSGSKHDYVSLSRYAWPDPTKKDGLPYIMRDGVSNPELNKFDRNKLSTMANAVYRLSLAYYFSGDEQYAAKAAELLRVWFLNPATKMNPHLRFAQHVPGVCDGRCYGVIDTYSFVEMLDGVQLLEKSKSFTSNDSKQLKNWFAQLLNWLQTYPQALEEKGQKNNHAIAYDVQVAAYALYTGKKDVFRKIVTEFPDNRIAKQIEPDGKQPYELGRTLAFHYSQYNLTHIIDLMLMAKNLGLDVKKYCVSGEHSFYKAMDFLAPYMGKDVKDWPYKQISGWMGSQQAMAKDYYRGYLLDGARKDWLALYYNNVRRDARDMFVLLYEKPVEAETGK